MSLAILPADVSGPILSCAEGLSFWGGVDPATGQVIDAHHPDHGAALTGRIVMMPTSRGSCSGSGVLLELALNNKAPAALIFRESEDVLTLGALVAAKLYHRTVAIIRLSPADYDALSKRSEAVIRDGAIKAGDLAIPVSPLDADDLTLSRSDQAKLRGDDGPALKLAMEVITALAAAQGAKSLIDVTRAHIDGCIFHSPANLIFAEAMRDMGAKTRIPTTINAISVDRENWRAQGVPPDFGGKAQALADAYTAMGARPTFTCAPYQAEDAPERDEMLGWSESNAVIYANSVLGARTAKHPDYLDLFIAMTGRAPLSGVYLDEHRRAQIVIEVDAPATVDDAFWPLLGWLAGKAAPDAIPRLAGVAHLAPTTDDLRALCAAFGSTSAAPMLHVEGVSPEADRPPAKDAPRKSLTADDFQAAWNAFNNGPDAVDLIALGSPHASLTEIRRFGANLSTAVTIPTIITLSRATRAAADAEGLTAALSAKGVQFASDICWCSITEPVFPPEARTLMTNSGKYAHYAPGLSGRAVRFGSLKACAVAAMTGRAPAPPDWL